MKRRVIFLFPLCLSLSPLHPGPAFGAQEGLLSEIELARYKVQLKERAAFGGPNTIFQLLLEYAKNSPIPSPRIEFTPDSRELLVFGRGVVIVLDAEIGDQSRILYTSAPTRPSISPDGRFLHYLSEKNTKLVVCDIQSGQEWIAFQGGNEEAIEQVSFSRDGNRIAVVTNRATHVRDSRTGVAIQEVVSHEVDGPIKLFKYAHHHAALNADGSRLVTSDWRGYATVWDVHTGKKIIQIKHQVLVSGKDSYKTGVDLAYFSSDGSKIFTTAYDEASLWDAASGKRLRTEDVEGRVSYSRLGADGKELVATNYNGTEIVWDLATGEKKALWRKTEGAWLVLGSFSPDRRLYFGFGAHARSAIYDLRNGEPVFKFPQLLSTAAFSPDGRKIGVVEMDGTVRIYERDQYKDLEPLTKKLSLPAAPPENVEDAAERRFRLKWN